jgi:hypothetical protein
VKAEIVCVDGRWIAKVVDGGEIIFLSKPENRPGCAARVAFNWMEQTFGQTYSTFVIDLEDW